MKLWKISILKVTWWSPPSRSFRNQSVLKTGSVFFSSILVICKQNQVEFHCLIETYSGILYVYAHKRSCQPFEHNDYSFLYQLMTEGVWGGAARVILQNTQKQIWLHCVSYTHSGIVVALALVFRILNLFIYWSWDLGQGTPESTGLTD